MSVHFLGALLLLVILMMMGVIFYTLRSDHPADVLKMPLFYQACIAVAIAIACLIDLILAGSLANREFERHGCVEH